VKEGSDVRNSVKDMEEEEFTVGVNDEVIVC